MTRDRAWLCVVPAALIALDVGLTLAGQPPEYWQGHYAAAEELNPPACWVLQQHPLLFAAGGLLWVAVVSAALLLLPRGWARATALAVVFGHTVGAASWLALRGAGGWVLALLLFGLAYGLLSWSWRREGSVDFPGRHPEHVGDPLAQPALAEQPRPEVGLPEAVDQRNGQGR
jgi:hypothetical protein